MRTGRAKGPPIPSGGASAKGTIIRLVIGQSYGFIRLRDGREAFFHRADMHDDTPFNTLQIGERVVFELIADVISGPRAIQVARVSESR